MDRRTKYTRNVIKQALHTCLDRHKLDDITIKELCLEADVNRATFYRHYKDIYDLFDTIGQELLQEIISSSPGKEMTMKLLESAKTYQSFYKEFYWNHLDKAYHLEAQKIVCGKLKELEHVEEGYPSVIFEHQFNHYNHGLLGIIKIWLNDNCEESIEVLYQSITSIISNQYQSLSKVEQVS